MTNDEILQAAKDAGLTGLSLIDVGYLERFAAIIEQAARADERERCIHQAGVALLGAEKTLSNRVINAIRALKEQV